jgi:hypothetical protein
MLQIQSLSARGQCQLAFCCAALGRASINCCRFSTLKPAGSRKRSKPELAADCLSDNPVRYLYTFFGQTLTLNVSDICIHISDNVDCTLFTRRPISVREVSKFCREWHGRQSRRRQQPVAEIVPNSQPLTQLQFLQLVSIDRFDRVRCARRTASRRILIKT